MTATEPGCDLFVDAADPDRVLALLGTHLGIQPSFSHLSLPGFEVRVGRNRLAEGGDIDSHDFLDWPTLVEVSARPGQDLDGLVAELTAALRAAGHRVTAVD